MEIEEYKKQKFDELKRRFANEEQALQEKGYHLNLDVFSEPYFDEKEREVGINVFLEITITPSFSAKLTYYHILCENFGQDNEELCEIEEFISQLQFDIQKIIKGGAKAFKNIYYQKYSPFRLA